MSNDQKTNTRKAPRKWFFKRKGFWFGLLFLAAVAGFIGYLVADHYTRPYRERAATYDLEQIDKVEVPSIIVDRNGKEIGRIFVQNRSVIPISKVSEVFINALTAGEDSRFFSHGGVDFIGTARAAKYTASGKAQGGSSITQQLARNAYNLKDEALKRDETTIQRKLVEAFLAMRIENRYSKKEILGFYLNRIYFGSGYWGIRSAALGYFGKEPKDLTTAECASIVTLIKNPNGRSPLNDPEANRTGRNYVLMRMEEEGFINKKEMRRLQAEPLRLNPKPLSRGTTHLYERVAEAVGNALGEDALASGGFTVHTTILAEAQEAAEKSLEESLARAEKNPGYKAAKHADYRKGSSEPASYVQGAVLMMDHETGEVLAHVGGRDYAQVPYDFIELGRRPLGTAFFPFIYATALEKGATPALVLEDEPMDNRSVMVGGREGILGEWGMEVPSPTYEGKVTMRHALETSKIGATVRLADHTGLQAVVDQAEKFGLPMAGAELLRRIAVGFESASLKQTVRAFSAFPKGGNLGPANLSYLSRVVAPDGRVVFPLRSAQPPRQPVVDAIDPATAWQIHSMMAGSLYRGSSKGVLGGLVEKPFQGAGKGGTTHDFSDCWFVGYNKRVTCGVWTGFLNGSGESIYPGAFSRDLAMPVWQAVMNAATPSFGGGKLEPPANVIEMGVCSISGQRATQFCHEYREDPATRVVRSSSTAVAEYFRKGTESLPFCSIHSGAPAETLSPQMTLDNMPAMDAVPVKPKGPVIVGEDPYHSELPNFAPIESHGGLMRKKTNVLDSFDLGPEEETISLPSPQRMEIHDEE
ncbi:MAG: transglycosylase domain-containing protein [Verrucomicrobiota bacterium]